MRKVIERQVPFRTEPVKETRNNAPVSLMRFRARLYLDPFQPPGKKVGNRIGVQFLMVHQFVDLADNTPGLLFGEQSSAAPLGCLLKLVSDALGNPLVGFFGGALCTRWPSPPA